MRFDIAKIDERIKKLQEIRRIACDPELGGALLEIVTTEDEQRTKVESAAPPVHANGPVANGPVAARRADETNDLIMGVVKDIGAHAEGVGLWHKKNV